MERTGTIKEQILWYIGRILDRLTDQQKRALITMLKKFYARISL